MTARAGSAARRWGEGGLWSAEGQTATVSGNASESGAEGRQGRVGDGEKEEKRG